MQIMPAAGAELKVGDIRVIEPNIQRRHQSKNMEPRHELTRYFPDAKFDQANARCFAFASVQRRPRQHLADAQGGGQARVRPGQVVQQRPSWSRPEKIGIETTTYVRNIFKYYAAYRLGTDVREEQRRARERSRPGN